MNLTLTCLRPLDLFSSKHFSAMSVLTEVRKPLDSQLFPLPKTITGTYDKTEPLCPEMKKKKKKMQKMRLDR